MLDTQLVGMTIIDNCQENLKSSGRQASRCSWGAVSYVTCIALIGIGTPIILTPLPDLDPGCIKGET